MRKLSYRAGLGTMLLAMSTSFACAGPLDRDATSKAEGDFIGKPHNTTGVNGTAANTNRAYSYVPQSEASAPVAPTPTAAESAQSATKSDGSTRSFSYSGPTSQGVPALRRGANNPGYFRADHKVLNNY